MSPDSSTPDSAKPTYAQLAAERVGTDLDSRWRIDKVLGVGGMGAVFACTHKNNGTRSAIKVLHPDAARMRGMRERFLREGKIANRVDHPARVAVVDDGTSDLGEAYLVMDLLSGMTLSDLFRRAGGKVPLEKLLGIFDVVLELLGKCHEVGIVHRDIKPANIFLTDRAEVKVLDFGVARMHEADSEVEATRAGLALGTASFIAPEQALGLKEIDGRADLFSVGACLFLGITGTRLHVGKTEAESFILAATKSAPSVAKLAPQLAPEVAAFVDRSLVYEQAQRFQSATEMRNELLKLVAGLRTGKLSGQRKGAAGVVTRGSDGIEIMAGLSEADQREQRDRLSSIFKQIGLSMASVRQYGLLHPQTIRALGQSYSEIGTALAKNSTSVRWEVTAGAFVFEGEPVWSPDRVPFDRIPHQLFADGVRKVQIKAGISEEELRDFLVILLRDGSSLFGADDDAVTALWDRRFEHIAYFAVDSFSGTDDLDDETSELAAIAARARAGAGLDKDLDDDSREAQALELNVVAQMEKAGEAAAAMSLDAATRATLGMQLAVTQERWSESFMDAFVFAYDDARRRGDVEQLAAALTSWTTDQIQLSAVDRVFEAQAQLAKSLRALLPESEAKALELETARYFFPIDVLRALLTEMANGRLSEADSPRIAELQKVVSKGLARAFDLLASDAVLSLVCDSLDATCPAILRDVLEAYVRRWAAGQEAALGSWLGRCGVDLGRFLVQVLHKLKTAESAAAIQHALDNRHLEVKLAALATMDEVVGDRAREEITSLVQAEDPAVRMRTLELIVSMNVVAAGPSLVRRVQNERFHKESVEERRKMLGTIAHLKPARAEALAIELLGTRKLLGGEAIDQSRALAAELLGHFDSKPSVDALTEASKQRWATSASVREAALESLAIIESRRSGSDDRRERRRDSAPVEEKSS
jgi:serine/threonine protein kinase